MDYVLFFGDLFAPIYQWEMIEDKVMFSDGETVQELPDYEFDELVADDRVDVIQDVLLDWSIGEHLDVYPIARDIVDALDSLDG